MVRYTSQNYTLLSCSYLLADSPFKKNTRTNWNYTHPSQNIVLLVGVRCIWSDPKLHHIVSPVNLNIFLFYFFMERLFCIMSSFWRYSTMSDINSGPIKTFIVILFYRAHIYRHFHYSLFWIIKIFHFFYFNYVWFYYYPNDDSPGNHLR